MDRARFFAGLKGGLLKGRLVQTQVEGVTSLLDAFEQRFAGGDLRHLAYMLATAHHETAQTFAPVRETLAASDAAAILLLERAFAAGRLAGVTRPYWRVDAQGRSWLGRGFVQLTHRDNYERLGARLGIDLAADPALAMRRDVAADILCVGMAEGLFTGRRLSDYFHGAMADWTGARAIINGRDGTAARIGAAARLIHAVLQQATGKET